MQRDFVNDERRSTRVFTELFRNEWQLDIEPVQWNFVKSVANVLDQPLYKTMHLKGENRAPLFCVGHTLDLYRALPYGWRTTP